MKNKKNKILVACHDAGAAEIISAYVKKHENKFNFQCFALSEIAIKIFKRKNVKFKLNPVIDPDADYLISGTGWGSKTELELIKEAKLKNIKTIAYLDHWTNYRERFGYPAKDWKANLPDEIWVGDKYAYDLAEKSFPGKPISVISILYFEEIKEECKEIKKRIGNIGKNILFMSEPIAPISPFGDKLVEHFMEFDVLENLLCYLSDKKVENKIIICYHPAESKDKYNSIIARYSNKLEIGKGDDVLKEIAQASLVIGMMSMILVVAHLCGKKVVSFIPDPKISCPLPFEGIIKIKKIEEMPWK